jgi:hypothetical protein
MLSSCRRSVSSDRNPEGTLPNRDQNEMAVRNAKMRVHETTQLVCFEIASGNGRQACTLQTKFVTKGQASRYLMSNWPMIERLARDALANGYIEDGKIKLVMK